MQKCQFEILFYWQIMSGQCLDIASHLHKCMSFDLGVLTLLAGSLFFRSNWLMQLNLMSDASISEITYFLSSGM